MVLKNTLKLLGSNFISVWKILVYKLLVLGIIAGLFCTTLGYLTKLSEFDILLKSIVNLFSTFSFITAPPDIMISFYEIIVHLFTFIGQIATTSPFILIFLIFLFAILLPYLWHLSDIAVNETLFGFMASQTKYGFTSSLIRNLVSANAYSWLYTLVALPINLLAISLILGITKLATLSGVIALFAPVLALITILVFFSLKFSLLSGWASAMTVTNANAFKGFTLNLRAIGRKFMSVWTVNVILVFAFMCVTLLTGMFGFVILLPLICFMNSLFGIVMFFENMGMRYYIDVDTIRQPKKLEQTDKIQRLKNII